MLLGSCSTLKHESKEQVLNKRKYRKGYYFHGFKTSQKKRPDAEKHPRIKFKAPKQLTHNIQNDNAITYRRSIHFNPISFKEIIRKKELVKSEKQTLKTFTKVQSEKLSPTVKIDQTKIIAPKRRQKQIEMYREKIEPKVSTGEYGSTLGLNSIGVSVFSRIGINAKGDTPWLAFVIPTFIFLTSSILFFFGTKRRKDQKAEYLAGLNNDQSAFSAAQNEGNANPLTREKVALHVSVYAAIIIIGLIYLY